MSQRGGKFQPGRSGNPRGRPRGACNKMASTTRKLLGKEADNIVRKLIEMALNGDPVAIRLCVERIYPRPKDAAIKATLPEINKFSDIPLAIGRIFQMIGGGHFTIEQGKALVNIVASQGNILELAEIEKRLSALEEKSNNEGKSGKTN